MTYLLTGFMLGVAGSVHCLGMCGPLMLLSRGDRRSSMAWWAFLVHHAGRVTIYMVLGFVAGLSGGAIARAGWRNGLAITAGLVLIAQASGVMSRLMGTGPGRFIAIVAARAGRRLPRQPLARAAAFGAINGLMPCGLLYGALAAAAGLGDARASVAFVAAFAGSLPAFAAPLCGARVRAAASSSMGQDGACSLHFGSVPDRTRLACRPATTWHRRAVRRPAVDFQSSDLLLSV